MVCNGCMSDDLLIFTASDLPTINLVKEGLEEFISSLWFGYKSKQE